MNLSALKSHGYTLGDKLGEGSFGDVKLAWSEKHKDFVAIKVFTKFDAPVEFLTKFLPREIGVVKGLSHPNVIKFLEAVETTHRLYIVMEYAENGTLKDVIKESTYIEEYPRAKHWFTQLIGAVEYCHERGVVHRDIKCENILVNKNYDLKLSDFGFARDHLKQPFGQNPTLCETFCRSDAYASPEILKEVPYEPQLSDVWAMGVVLFVMVFGQLPFDDSNFKKLVRQVESKVKFPSNPAVSDQCESLIEKLIAPLGVRLRVSQIANEPWMLLGKPFSAYF